jgi:RNA polymerase sigma-70 factor (ECF subfamily)
MTSSSLTDGDLLRRIGAGDMGAIAELYDRYAPILFPLALRIVRDRAEAEDVVHDAFVTVSDRAAQYAPERGSVVAWLVTLVRNLSIDRTRRRDRRGALARDVLAYEPVAEVEGPEALTASAAERAMVRRALDALPEAQRATLEVAFFEGLTYAEIAARENVPLGTIKSRAARAILSLREALEREGLSAEEVARGRTR